MLVLVYDMMKNVFEYELFGGWRSCWLLLFCCWKKVVSATRELRVFIPLGVIANKAPCDELQSEFGRSRVGTVELHRQYEIDIIASSL